MSWCQPHRSQYLNSCQQQEDQTWKLLLILFYKECDVTDLQKNQIWTRTYTLILFFICSFLDLRVKQKAPLHRNVNSGCYYLIMTMFLWKRWLPKIFFYSDTLPLAEKTTHIWKTITFFYLVADRQVSQKQHKRVAYHHRLGCYSPLKWVEKKSGGGRLFPDYAFQPPQPWEKTFPCSAPIGAAQPQE